MNDWEFLFQKHILERGYGYYKEGRVLVLSHEEDECEARVEGSENYVVEIKFSDKMILDMYCNCPYAEDGNRCKHMAAVLYFIEDNQEEDESAKEESEEYVKTDEIKKVIDKMSELEAKQMLLDLAKENLGTKNKIITRFSKSIDKKTVKMLKKEVDSIILNYSGYDGYVYHRDGYNLTNDIYEFLYTKGERLVEKGYNTQAFEVVNYVFLSLEQLEMEDSDGGIDDIASCCCDLWTTIISQCTEDEKRSIFKWFRSHQRVSPMSYFKDYVEHFIMCNFDEEEFLFEKLKDIDKRMLTFDSDEELETYYSNYEYKNDILNRLKIMKALDLPLEDIKDYRQKYSHMPEIRKDEIDEYLDKGDYDKAIQLLQESKSLDEDDEVMVSKHSQMLMEIYEKNNMAKEYKEELENYVFTFTQRNLDYVKKLKALCPSNWSDNLERILAGTSYVQLRLQLLKDEKMYRRLFDEIVRLKSIGYLDEYEYFLGKKFPDEVRKVYIDYVLASAESANTRNGYKTLAKYLKKIVKYPNGEELTDKIVSNWRIKYKRRTAMQEELTKAGF